MTRPVWSSRAKVQGTDPTIIRWRSKYSCPAKALSLALISVSYTHLDVYKRQLRLGRIAARGGDTVTVTDTGALIINGSTVAEPDITTPTQPVEGGPDYPVTLAEGELFLLCDARTTGADSRLYGPIPQRQVQGTAVAALRRSGL